MTPLTQQLREEGLLQSESHFYRDGSVRIKTTLTRPCGEQIWRETTMAQTLDQAVTTEQIEAKLVELAADLVALPYRQEAARLRERNFQRYLPRPQHRPVLDPGAFFWESNSEGYSDRSLEEIRNLVSRNFIL